MASDEEYVNYNGDDSRNGYHDFTENNNTDQAAGQNHPIERRVPKRTPAGGYSSKKNLEKIKFAKKINPTFLKNEKNELEIE